MVRVFRITYLHVYRATAVFLQPCSRYVSAMALVGVIIVGVIANPASALYSTRPFSIIKSTARRAVSI